MTAAHPLARILEGLPSAAVATFLALFPIVNPFGGVPVFFSLTSSLPAAERRHTALKTAGYVIAILVVFLFFGRFVLIFFGISLPVLRIAGGLIVANTAWGMVTGNARMTSAETDEAATKADISLTPMAMPMLSGPGSIGVVMGLAADANSSITYVGMVIGIVALGLVVYLFLCLGGPLVKRLGPGAVGAINRIFGFLLLAIAVQLVWDGVADFPH
ncbi:MAG: MarC family protein [Terriglobales bacterium]|jgi:multiple antibiotic resistance protein